MHMLEVMKAIEELVVMADCVDLGLRVTQFVDCLHLAGDPRTGSTKVAPRQREAAVRGVFERAHPRQEQLQRIDIPRVGDIELAVVLLEGINDRVELAFFFALIFPVSVHCQAKRVFPFVPVVDLDAFEFVVRKDLIHRLVGGFPSETARQHRVVFLNAQLLRCRVGGAHVMSPICRSGFPFKNEFVIRLVDVAAQRDQVELQFA